MTDRLVWIDCEMTGLNLERDALIEIACLVTDGTLEVLGEASVKIRTGPPGDELEDLDLPVWAGVVPMTTSFGEPEPDPALRLGITAPGHIRARAGAGRADRSA